MTLTWAPWFCFLSFWILSWAFSSVCTACPHHSYLSFGLPRTLCFPPQPLNSLAFSSLPGLPPQPKWPLSVPMCDQRLTLNFPSCRHSVQLKGLDCVWWPITLGNGPSSPASPSFWGVWKCSREDSWDSHGQHVAEVALFLYLFMLWICQFDSLWVAKCLQSLLKFSSVQSLSRVQLFAIPWTAAHQASLCITNSQGPTKPTSIESVMPSNHLNLCRPLLLLPSIFPSIRVFSNESALHIRWPKYWSFSFSISPSNEHPGLIFFRRTG